VLHAEKQEKRFSAKALRLAILAAISQNLKIKLKILL
jgi:hypothetical protein